MSDKKRNSEFDLVVILSLYASIKEADRPSLTELRCPRHKTKARLKGRLIEYCRDSGLDYDKVAVNLAVDLLGITPDFGSFML